MAQKYSDLINRDMILDIFDKELSMMAEIEKASKSLLTEGEIMGISWCRVKVKKMIPDQEAYLWTLYCEEGPNEGGLYLVTGKRANEDRKYWICEMKDGEWITNSKNPDIDGWTYIPRWEEPK